MPEIYAKGMTRKEYDRARWKKNGAKYRITTAENLLKRYGGVVTWPDGKPEEFK